MMLKPKFQKLVLDTPIPLDSEGSVESLGSSSFSNEDNSNSSFSISSEEVVDKPTFRGKCFRTVDGQNSPYAGGKKWKHKKHLLDGKYWETERNL